MADRELSGWLVCDLETTTRMLCKHKASPYDPANRIVAAGWQFKGGEVQGAYYPKLGKQQFGLLADLLEQNPKFFVGHNIGFDIKYLMRDPKNRQAYMDWVVSGGIVWDTQISAFHLHAQHPDWQMPSLEQCALESGGNVKDAEVKALWAAGVDTEDIEPALLNKYLLGGTDEFTGELIEGDIGNSRIVFLDHVKRVKAAGMSKFMILAMLGRMATVEMEFNGLHIDQALAEVLRAKRAEEVQELEAKLLSYLPDNKPAECEFKLSSRFHLSALLFGGLLKYKKSMPVLDDEGNPTFAQMDVDGYVCIDCDGVECVITPEEWEQHGEEACLALVRHKTGKKAGEIKTRKLKVNDPSRPKTKQTEFLFELPGYIPAKKKWATAEPGIYSTNAETLDEIIELYAAKYPFVKDLHAYKAAAKDLATYYWVENGNGDRKGMMTLVNPHDGKIHGSINHTNVISGRLSSNNPNLQNIPGGKRSYVKKCFISRFEGGEIIQSDFTSLEVYVGAWLTRSPTMIQMLKDGTDFHCYRLAKKEGKGYEDVVKLCKVDELPEWVAKRKATKEFSFQLQYGSGAANIATTTGMDIEDVQALMEQEGELFPEFDELFRATQAEVEESAEDLGETVFHPMLKRDVPIRTGYSVAFTGKKYSFTEQVAPDFMFKKGVMVSFSPTQQKNYKTQGTGCEVMIAALGLMLREFYRRNNWNGRALLVSTVHDAAYADTAPEVKKEVMHVIHACMSLASVILDVQFNADLQVGVPSETVSGINMKEENHLDFDQELYDNLKQELRERWLGGKFASFEK